MTVLAGLTAAEPTPPTNRGVYPLPGWAASAFDYYRATVPGDPIDLFRAIAAAYPGMDLSMDAGPTVANYDEHRILRDRLGRHRADLFWGGANGRPNVQAKGQEAAVIAAVLRAGFEHFPSRADTQRTGARQDLYPELYEFSERFAAKRGLAFRDIDNHDPDKGNTFMIGSRLSTAFVRGYQPGLKRAQEEGRTGDSITDEERNSVRIELECKPDKPHAKRVVSTLSADDLWGVSPWVAEYASEVFAMKVQPVTISERRESNRARALRFMGKQYAVHLRALIDECDDDMQLFGETIASLAGYYDLPDEVSRAKWELHQAGHRIS